MFTIEKKSVKVGKLVNTAHVNELISNYKKERWAHNTAHIGKADSMSVWWSIEELEDFIAKAKDHGADGLRMFFGAYGKETAPNDLYAERQTIVMVATKDKKTETGKTARKEVYYNTEEGPSVLAYNLGGICPPWCGTGTGDTDPDGIDISINILDKA
jgi:hypothetical protein